MNIYNPKLEQFVDKVDFGPNDSCVWIVYPPGCAGDLLASIVNFHYIETGARFKGITNTGRVIFRSSDMKLSNKKMQRNELQFDSPFFWDVAESLSARNLNWSLMDNFIFSNHGYADNYIQMILDTFTNCKIIRMLPRTYRDREIVQWMHKFKNSFQVATTFVLPDNADDTLPSTTHWDDPRVLTVFFSDLVNQKKFAIMYQSIQQHLNFPGPMIAYDFVKYWIDCQHPKIREHINWLSQY